MPGTVGRDVTFIMLNNTYLLVTIFMTQVFTGIWSDNSAFVVFVFGPSARVMLEGNAVLVGFTALLEGKIASLFTDTSHSATYSMVTASLCTDGLAQRWEGLLKPACRVVIVKPLPKSP